MKPTFPGTHVFASKKDTTVVVSPPKELVQLESHFRIQNYKMAFQKIALAV